MIGFIVGFFSINIPAKTLIKFFLLFFLERTTIQVQSVLAKPLGFYFLLSRLPLL
jgi:hypothetical protein